MDKEIKVRIKALVDGMQNVKEFQTALKSIQSQGNKKFDITGGGSAQGNTQKVIGLFRQLSGTSDMLGGKVEGVAKSLGLAEGALGAAALGAGVLAGVTVGLAAGIFTLAKQASDAGSRFNDLSIKTGLSVETLSGLSLQLTQSGADVETLSNAVFEMQKRIEDAAGGNKDLQATFARLGLKDTQAALADTDGSLRTLLKSLGQVKDEGERNALGAKVLGRQYKDLAVFVSDLNGDVDGAIEKARALGVVMSADAARAADEFGDKLDALSAQLAGVGRTIGIEVMPVVLKALEDFSKWLSDNKDGVRELAGATRELAGELSNYLKYLHDLTSGNWTVIIRQKFESFGEGFQQSPVLRDMGRNFGARLFNVPGQGVANPQGDPNNDRDNPAFERANFPTPPRVSSRASSAGGGGKGGGAGGGAEQKALQEKLKLLALELKETERVYREEVNSAERAHEKKLISLQDYVTEAVSAEQNRLTATLATLQKEADEISAHSKEKVKQLAEIAGKRADEETKSAERIKQIRDAADRETERAAKQHQDNLLRLKEAAIDNEIARIRLGAGGAEDNDELERRAHELNPSEQINAITEILNLERVRHLERLSHLKAEIESAGADAIRVGELNDQKAEEEKRYTAILITLIGERAAARLEESRQAREVEEQIERNRLDDLKEMQNAARDIAGDLAGIVKAGFDKGWEGVAESFVNLLDRLATELLNSLFYSILAKSLGIESADEEGSGGGGLLGGILNVFGFAGGGFVEGPGTSTSDSIPALLSDGEYVVRAAAVQRLGVSMLDRLNAMGAPHFAEGGFVTDQLEAVTGGAGRGGGNVYLSQTLQFPNVRNHKEFQANERAIKRDIGRAAREGIRQVGS